MIIWSLDLVTEHTIRWRGHDAEGVRYRMLQDRFGVRAWRVRDGVGVTSGFTWNTTAEATADVLGTEHGRAEVLPDGPEAA